MVVLATSTLNRVMVVEWSLPAILPGTLVALHYAVQVLRPRMGHGSDMGRRRTPWIIGGMAALSTGSVLAAAATGLMGAHLIAGLALALAAYTLIGLGVGAAGTSLLVLLAARLAPARRAGAASVVWIMMIAGIAVTATIAGMLLDPFSPARLLAVVAAVAAAGFALSLFAVWGMEGAPAAAAPAPAPTPFAAALRQVWAEPKARRFAIFVFLSMLAYSAQELVIEPFAGAVFHLTPGESTALAGLQHGGVLAGMLIVAIAGSVGAGAMRLWTVGGCVGSAFAIAGLAASGLIGPAWPLRPAIFILGIANGTFAVAAIGSMMALASAGRASREGVRMGVWGAAQAVAFALGGLAGTLGSDLARTLIANPAIAYAAVFAGEALLFLLAACQAAAVFGAAPARLPSLTPVQAGE
jgi:BCD family chlorophyll transporter-like MFS transporter